jgi:hypothetical protein
MHFRSSQIVSLAVVAVSLSAARPTYAQFWKSSAARAQSSRPESGHPATRATNSTDAATPNDSAQNAQPTAAGEFGLTQDSGPWLVVAASFSGNGAEKQSHDLAQELRERFRLHAYVHQMEFKLGDDSTNGAGYGGSSRRHYRRDEVRELAVLVGDFPSIDGPDAQQALARIKTLEPNALNVDPNQTAQTLAQVHQFENAMLEKLGKARKKGPMAQAFFTRNPLLPHEYFVPKGVDAFVTKMNEGVEHSLLDNPGRQTIQVATFRGKTILQTNADDSATKSFFSIKKNNDPLIEAAENAHLLTKELRAHGYEAYEFHDRTQSIVTIGAFASATQQLPDGRVVAVPEVQKVVQTFDASFDTPADPLTGIGNDSRTQKLVEEQQQQVRMKLNNQQAQVVGGLNPKHVKILSGRGKAVKTERIIPMDVHPQVIDVPKRSVSSAYAS